VSPARRNPYPALIVAAALPALALFWLWRFAVSHGGSVQATSPSTTVATTPLTSLPTPVLSVRRAPATLALEHTLDEFRQGVQPLLGEIDSTSCVAISVNGVAVAARNETLALRPASNVKTITAAVALDVLGEDHTFTTTLAGQVVDGVATGDVYLIGGGDPLLANTWWNGPNSDFPPFNVTSMEAFADVIVGAGVTRIDGDVVGDASRYDDIWYLDTWAEVDRFSNVGPISALMANDSRERIDTSSNDPVEGAAQVLIGLLAERGVTVGGAADVGVAPAGLPVIATITSQPLPAVLAEMLTTSDNNTAEMLVKEIGVAERQQGTTEAGMAVIRDRLAAWRLPTDGVTLVDGSGISDENRVTCALMLALLQRESADGPVGAGMAVAGAPGGTLADAFVDTPLEGLLRAKTGTLNNVDGIANKPGAKTLAGYVPLPGGGAIEFALLLNGELITDMGVYRPVWAALADALATYPTAPTAADLAPFEG
jgi:D-alanyl-D-alanine carboxypeptidase/D-alanyl-D-alanine-endopeptidase (penicillin-binding protein 4)